MTASIRERVAAAVGLTEPVAAAAFDDTLTTDRDTYGGDYVTHRLQAARAAVTVAFPAAGVTATPTNSSTPPARSNGHVAASA